MQRFRGGLVCKAHRLVYRINLGSRVMKKQKKDLGGGLGAAQEREFRGGQMSQQLRRRRGGAGGAINAALVDHVREIAVRETEAEEAL